MRLLMIGVLTAMCAMTPRVACAQAEEHTLSDSEVESLRAAAYIPDDRITAFIKILNKRAEKMDALVTKRRKPGREQDLKELYEQISEIADELNDNLEEYAPKHRDVRKTLPKLIEATERWGTTLRSAAEEPSYKVSRTLALDAVRDVHDAAVKMQAEQVAYFKEHPEAAAKEKARITDAVDQPHPVCIPR